MSTEPAAPRPHSEGYLERHQALAAFDECAADASAAQVCGVYYCGEGGQGKTSILNAIYIRYTEDPRYRVLPLIDFAATEVQSIRGLRTALRTMAGDATAFQEYDLAVRALEDAEAERAHESIIAGLDARAERRFLEALRLIAAVRPLIFCLDTFERVQDQDVGWWVLRVLLPALARARVALAGRPEPKPAEVPSVVRTYRVAGFTEPQTRQFLEEYAGDVFSPDEIRRIHAVTEGRPLLLHLVLDALGEAERRAELFACLAQLPPEPSAADRDRFAAILTQLFADPGDPLNWLIWAMAALRRRFDLDILQYLVENSPAFAGRGVAYPGIYQQLRGYDYVKPNPEQHSHLLHDEIQRLVNKHILQRISGEAGVFASLYDLIVNAYYPSAIATAAGANPSLARQLRAEHLGYTLDGAVTPAERDAAIERYRKLATRAATEHDYALEELIWREMRTYLTAPDRVVEQKQTLYGDRGRFLQRHHLFRKMALHYDDMALQFPAAGAPVADAHVEALLYLSLAHLRLGNLAEARASIERCDRLVPETNRRTRADLEITWGQIDRAAGQWLRALEHYEKGADHAMQASDMELLASAYLNRSYVWALQGRYRAAREQCDRALGFLQGLEGSGVTQRRIFAQMNKGSAYRYEGLYREAKEAYQESLALAQADNNQEAICELMQHLGINAYLMGRTERRDIVEVNDACTVTGGPVPSECKSGVEEAAECQRDAWGYLIEAFEMAWYTDWRGALGSTLHRLAKVYREVHRMRWLLESFELGDKPAALVELETAAQAYPMPLELQFEGRLVDTRPWEQLDWLGRALRLFDMSALLADEVGDLHRALDALTELARAATEAGDAALLQKVWQRVETLQGYDYHRDLFEAMNDISRADLHFVNGEVEAALAGYKEAYIRVARESGYASFLLLDRLRDLRWRLEALAPGEALRWLRELQDAWAPELKAHDQWADIITFLDDLRLHFLRKEKAQAAGDPATA